MSASDLAWGWCQKVPSQPGSCRAGGLVLLLSASARPRCLSPCVWGKSGCHREHTLQTARPGHRSCPALPWLLPEDARGLVRAGMRISQEFGLPLDPKIRVLGTVRVLPALSRSPFSSGAGVSRTTVSETLDAVPQAGALSSTGGSRQGCLCPAGPSGCGWHESVARLSRSRARWHGPSAVSGDRSRGLAPGSTRLLCASCQERSGELRREGVHSPAPSAELVALGGCADSRAGAGRQLSRHPLGVPAPAAPAFVIEPVVPTATRAPVGVRQLWLRWP